MNTLNRLLFALQETYEYWGRDDRAYTKKYKENHVKATLINLKTSLDTLNSYKVLPKYMYVRLLRNNEIWIINTESSVLYNELFDN